MPDIALYQPDIPQNAGTILRLAACMAVAVHVIEPCGFSPTDRSLKRAGLDYLERAALHKHANWAAFETWRETGRRRLLAFSTKASANYSKFSYHVDDVLLMGRESAGLPEEALKAADARLLIPMATGMRSLNVAVAAGMALGEALRQTGSFA